MLLGGARRQRGGRRGGAGRGGGERGGGERRRGRAQLEAGQQRARIDERDPAPLGDLDGHRLQAAADDAGEAAQGALGDRHVGEPADVQVQHALGGDGRPVRRDALGGNGRRAAGVEGADQRERGEVDALGAQAGVAHGAQQPLDHLALSGDDDHALARAGGRVEDAERVEVQHGAGERHRHLVLGLGADRGGERLLVVDGRQLQRAQDRALVGETDPHAPTQPGLAEELVQRLPERPLVEDLALAHGVGRQRRAGRALDDDPAVDVRLHGRDVARLDVQADDVGAAAAAEREAEVQCGERGHGSVTSWVRARRAQRLCAATALPERSSTSAGDR